ncbi:MAG: O-antigen ligase family protein [Bacteroidota bacterium]
MPQAVPHFSLDRLPPWITAQNIAWFGTFALVITLSWSEAIQNIASGFIVLGALWHLASTPRPQWIEDRSRWIHGLLISGIFGLSLLGGLYTETEGAWITDVRQKLPFLILGLTLGVLPGFSYKQFYLIIVAFLLTQSIIALLSIADFFQHFEMGMGRISRNANIPIAVKISHIYFGLLLSGSVIFGLGIWLKKTYIRFSWERHVVLGLTIFNFLALHLLSTRTGLLALYMGLGLGLMVYIIRSRAWKIGGTLFLLLLSLPLISYYTIPTFRTRIHATIWDIQGYKLSDRDLSHHSASLRLVAWEASLNIFIDSPVIGVGIGDLEQELATEFKRLNVRAAEEHLPKNPHNQYFEYLVGFGLVGFSLLLTICLFPWFAKKEKISFLFISFVGIYIGAMFAESLLERQIGIYFFLIFIMLLPSYPPFALFPKALSKQ